MFIAVAMDISFYFGVLPETSVCDHYLQVKASFPVLFVRYKHSIQDILAEVS